MYKKDLLRHDIQTFYTLQTITHYAYIAYFQKRKSVILLEWDRLCNKLLNDVFLLITTTTFLQNILLYITFLNRPTSDIYTMQP